MDGCGTDCSRQSKMEAIFVDAEAMHTEQLKEWSAEGSAKGYSGCWTRWYGHQAGVNAKMCRSSSVTVAELQRRHVL